MVLRLVFNGTNRFAFTTTGLDLTDPTLTPTAPAFNVSIQNLTLYLATEQNLAIENELRAKVHSSEGFSMLIPYIYTNKIGLPVSASQSISTRYNRGHGLRLKKCIYAPYFTTESVNTNYDHSNLSAAGVAGAKITNLYSALDNNRLQQYNVDCTNGSGMAQDWLEMQKYCKGSVICTSNQYQYNWFWIDNWAHFKAANENDNVGIQDSNLIEGLDLTEEKKYDIFLTVPNVALNHYVFAVTEKLMTIGPQGIVVS